MGQSAKKVEKGWKLGDLMVEIGYMDERLGSGDKRLSFCEV